MRKIIAVLFFVLFFQVNAFVLKGNVQEQYIPSGFFGSWGVISKLTSSNNPTAFNFESRDIWTLSGQGNTLVLENLESGAHSEIIVKEKSIDGKTLKFSRTKEVRTKEGKTIYYETVSFTLNGNYFSGTDNFQVKYFDTNDTHLKTDEAVYYISGVRISGNIK